MWELTLPSMQKHSMSQNVIVSQEYVQLRVFLCNHLQILGFFGKTWKRCWTRWRIPRGPIHTKEHVRQCSHIQKSQRRRTSKCKLCLHYILTIFRRKQWALREQLYLFLPLQLQKEKIDSLFVSLSKTIGRSWGSTAFGMISLLHLETWGNLYLPALLPLFEVYFSLRPFITSWLMTPSRFWKWYRPTLAEIPSRLWWKGNLFNLHSLESEVSFSFSSPFLTTNPKELKIGNTIEIFSRKFLIYDVDKFTQSFFKDNYGVTDFTPLRVDEDRVPLPARVSFNPFLFA